ncbi:MAG: hypothetical protein ACRDE8_04570, partial [Ginsengibacter sp.]
MKKIFITLLMFAVTSLLFGKNTNAQTNSSSSGLLRHIVIITFKTGVPADSVKALDNIYTTLSK